MRCRKPTQAEIIEQTRQYRECNKELLTRFGWTEAEEKSLKREIRMADKKISEFYQPAIR